jgi:hypothetical protein
MGAISPKEFRVRALKEGDQVKMIILHEELTGTGPVATSREWNIRKDTLARYHMPAKEKFVEFIEAQPNYEHDLKTLAEKLVGSVVDSHTKNAAYRALTSVAEQARNDIVQRKGGRFTEEYKGRVKVYTWTKGAN